MPLANDPATQPTPVQTEPQKTLTLSQLFTQLAEAVPSDQHEASDLPASHSVSRAQLVYQQLINAAANVMEIPFQSFQLDSRQVNENDAFVLLKSHSNDVQRSRQYAQQAQQTAAFILSEVDVAALGMSSESHSETCPVIHVPDIRYLLGSLIQAALMLQASPSSQFTHQPFPLPKVAAVTGTNGKTTVSQLLAQLCQGAAMTSAVMGTAGNGRLGQLTQATHTTGDVLAVQKFLRQMADEQVEILALEASSHGLHQQRLQGVPIQVAIYTNLSRDHLDYHTDMSEYATAKANLFDSGQFTSLTHAIINIDDPFAPLMLETAAASGIEVWTYSTRPDAQASFVARQIQPSLTGATIEIDSDFGCIWVESPLLGLFNVANLLAAIAGAIALGVEIQRIPELVKALQGASGRMQRVAASEGCFIVDYAHTPDALSQVLTSLKAHCEGNLWAVFGCGGDRDTGKRPLMAQAGLALADRVILTADNPRSEDPLAILADMQVGIIDEQRTRTQIEPDRRRAIMMAVDQAGPADIVVIAGKGHETYQEIQGVRHDFDDTVVVHEALSQCGKASC